VALLATVSLLVFRAGLRIPVLPRALVLLTGLSADTVPGTGTFKVISGDIQWWAVSLSLVGLVVGAAGWALGSHSSNYQYTSAGKRAVVVSGLAALLIGAAPSLVQYFFGTGQHLH
jgi:hypothetical protein